MLSLSLLTLGLATIGAYAKPTTRAPGGLEISLSTPADTVASVSEIRVVAAVKNIGDEELTIRKLGTVLDKQHPTRSFVVTKDGKDVPFTGFKVCAHSLPSASPASPTIYIVDTLSENDVVIPAGTTVTVEHDVSTVYEFSAAGPGTFTFDPVSGFQIIGANNTIGANIARSVSITVIDVPKRELLNLEKRVTVDCINKGVKKTIWSAYMDARVLANHAITNIFRLGPGDPLYKQYFGSNNFVNVVANFIAITSQEDNPAELGCDECNLSYYRHGSIRFCKKFIELPSITSLCTDSFSDPRNTQGGTMLVALSPPVLNADGDKMNCDKVGDLPNSEKFTNVANYACYASEVYKSTHCDDAKR